jgi:D-galactonate transporter
MAASEIEVSTTSKVTRRFVAFLVICYFVAYLDRVNVGFAKLTMDADLGISDTAFGFGAGIFFFAYFLFEVPSNMLLDKFGASKWIARIMFTWGLVSGAMAFIPQISAAIGVQPVYTFYGLRVLLGFAEAGFFPGIIFFLTLWFPAAYRARIIGYFMAAIPLSSALGSPLSANLLGLDGLAGLKGWQWLYVCEAAPSLVLSVAVFFYLTDRPAAAKWLTNDERGWLANRLAAEDKGRAHVSPQSALASLYDPRVLLLALVYFGAVACNYAISFWLPTIVKAFGVSTSLNGWINAVPYTVGFLGMIWWGRRSDARQERVFHLVAPLAIAAVGIGISGFIDNPYLKMISLTIGAFGVFAALPVFWTLPTAILGASTAAAGIAAINSIGNLAGYFGPFAMGYIKDATGSFAWGLAFVGATALIALIITLSLGHDTSLEKAPPEAARARG